MLIRIFGIVAPILFVVLVGYFYARRKHTDMNSANAANIDVFVPFLILGVFSGQSIHIAEFKNLIILTAIITLVPGVLSIVLSRFLKIKWKTLAPTMMFKNSGNLGIPLLLLAFGEEYLPAILMMFIVENTLHFTVGYWILSPRGHVLSFLKQPIILATVAGIALSIIQVQLPEWMVTAFQLLGDIAVPLMLFALGVRLVHLDWSGWKTGLLGTVLAPLTGLIAVAPFIGFFDLTDQQRAMIWLFAALPPAVLNFLLAERYQQEPEKVASIVMFANTGSVFIIPAMLFFVL